MKNHEKFVDEGWRLHSKWNNLRTESKNQSLKLNLANLYLKCVHGPMRQVRTGVRAYKEHKSRAAIKHLIEGSVHLAIYWPYYLIVHHRKHQRLIRKEVEGVAHV